MATLKNWKKYQPSGEGALANRLQRHTSCKIQNGHHGALKWLTGSGNGSDPRFLSTLLNFCKISFLIGSLLLLKKVDDGEKQVKRGKKIMTKIETTNVVASRPPER